MPTEAILFSLAIVVSGVFVFVDALVE